MFICNTDVVYNRLRDFIMKNGNIIILAPLYKTKKKNPFKK